jgi:hypothetical protein
MRPSDSTHLAKAMVGKDNIRCSVQAFFDRYPDGKFENLKVVVASSPTFCSHEHDRRAHAAAIWNDDFIINVRIAHDHHLLIALK